MRKPPKTNLRTTKSAATPKTAALAAAASKKTVVATQPASAPKPPVEVTPRAAQSPAKRFTLSSASARGIAKELDRLFETLPDLRRAAPQWAEMIDSDDDEACYGCIAIAAAGILYAVARDDDNEELSDLDYNDDDYPAWLSALVRLHKHGDMHPWGNPTLAMLEWAKRVIKVRPAPDGEVAFDELCETMGIDVS